MGFAEVVARVAADLGALGARYAVIGGVAVAARARARFTADLDLAVAVGSDRDAERLVFDLRQRGYEILNAFENQAGGRLATVRLIPHGEAPKGMIVDLLFASSGIENEAVEGADLYEVFPHVRLPVARREHLIAMKILAYDPKRRPQDRVDALNLVKASSVDELVAAERALRAIEQRGYARGKDLLGDLAELKRLAEPD